MNAVTAVASSLPNHVPPNLVRPFPFRRGWFSDRKPHDIAQEVHENWPDVFYVKDFLYGGHGWVFRRAADLREIMFDTEHFSSHGMAPFAELTGGNYRLVPLEADPPEHTFFRAIMNPLFTPKRMAALEDAVRDHARTFIEEFRRDGYCDFVKQFALQFPTKVFLNLMGLPLELAPQFLAWEKALVSAGSLEEITRNAKEVVAYLEGEIADRQNYPREDFITYGTRANIRERKLSADDLLGYCLTLYTGGLDTVASHLGHIFRHLAENQDHQRRLRESPELIPDAVDEMMRGFASVMVTRQCIKERTIHGVRICPGDRVAISLALAGRDPAEFDRPDQIILDRKAKMLSFGHGAHICIGIHLAKRELRIALEEFLKAVPEFHIAPGAEIISEIGHVLQLTNLPLAWRA